jgi:hypothetical protein
MITRTLLNFSFSDNYNSILFFTIQLKDNDSLLTVYILRDSRWIYHTYQPELFLPQLLNHTALFSCVNAKPVSYSII